jgi:hypothetical protein
VFCGREQDVQRVDASPFPGDAGPSSALFGRHGSGFYRPRALQS